VCLTTEIMNSTQSPKVLVAVLNWGIGHASRCVPLINELQKAGKEVVVFSDGIALEFLIQQFPGIEYSRIPSYNIRYTGKVLLFEMFFQLPNIAWSAFKEKQMLRKWLKKNPCELLFSDNRLGCFSKSVPSYYISHQLNIQAGFFGSFASFCHFLFYRNFRLIIVPDQRGEGGLSGILSKPFSKSTKTIACGIWSRFESQEAPTINTKKHILILLSGPEPARSQWEQEILSQIIKEKSDQFILVRGTKGNEIKEIPENLLVYDLIGSAVLQKLVLTAEGVICRSGYSTLMDLAVLKSKVFAVPTPGQTEQIYLAQYHAKQNHLKSGNQKQFSLRNAVNELRNGQFGFPEVQKANFKELLSSLSQSKGDR